MHILPGARYLLRELLPRFVVLSLLFKFVVDFIPGLTFTGGFFAAGLLGLVMTFHFMLLGAHFFAWSPVMNFLANNQTTQWLKPTIILFVFVEPALVLELVSWFSFGAFAINGVFAAFVASVLMNIGCFVTHDWATHPNRAMNSRRVC
jgi:uncharacterized membrane protein YvlD (DUF360 family)